MSDALEERWINMEKSDLDFVYADCDSHMNEIAELYAYSEEDEITANKFYFHELMEDQGLPLKWTDMTTTQHNRVFEMLSDSVELSDSTLRKSAIRATLYLLQGVFGECSQIEDQPKYARKIAFQLYERDMFHMFIQLLAIEIDENNPANANRPPPTCLDDSTDLRMILNVLYTFVVIMLEENEKDTPKQKVLREQFKEELSHPLRATDELLVITLFQMCTRFCNGAAPHFPIKKIVLLLWKVILLTLGGMDQLRELKNKYRKNANLPPVPDDTLEVARNMRAMTPPLGYNEMLHVSKSQMNDSTPKRKGPVFQRQMSVNKFNGREGEQNAAFDDGNVDNGDNGDNAENVDNSDNGESEDTDVKDNEEEEKKEDEDGDSTIGSWNSRESNSENAEVENIMRNCSSNLNEGNICETPIPGSPQSLGDERMENILPPISKKGLPWAPKVRQEDIDAFLDQARQKFFGFSLPNNRVTLAGLPRPIIESIKILNSHIYVSLAEAQIKREEEFEAYPLTTKELDEECLNSPAERLYQAMLPNAPHFMISLLKILFAAAPSPKAKTDSINIICDVLPEEAPTCILANLKLTIDVNRHKEIIVKAISAILLLLLKHYKINHIYQFEYLSQQLLFANCIPLILKYFNQNVCGYVISRNTISVIDFPACVIGEQTDLTEEILEMGCIETPYCWRNLFSCINLLRIMIKLNKWKPLRITSLIVLKTQNILRKTLKVRQATLQLYVLKLFKMQMRHLGRQWRKLNMKMLSGIYQKVRHRFTDDWASCNPIESNKYGINYQVEEFAIQNHIARFHKRRYAGKAMGANMQMSQFSLNEQSQCAEGLGLDFFNLSESELSSLLGDDAELTDMFKNNYEAWLEQEVFNHQIDWDKLCNEDEEFDL